DGNSLDCDFNSTLCCWKNKGNGVPWKIYRNKNYNNENGTLLHSQFRDGQFFLATSVTVEEKFSDDWTSCVTCSETGLFIFLIRAYQLPKTRIELCWKFVSGKNSIYRYCTFLRNSKSNNYVRKRFAVRPYRPIKFYIKLHNHGESTAIATINSIRVITEECPSPFYQSEQRPMRLISIKRAPEKEILKIRPITSQDKIMKPAIIQSSSTTQPNLNSSFTLRDIFGNDFAQFLEDDTDGLIVKNKQFEKDSVSSEKQVSRNNDIFETTTTTTKAITMFNFNLLQCNTIGGCLFDYSMCSYQNSPLSRGSTFQRVKLRDRNFMQAFTKPNTVAVLETDTSFAEEHKIVFDVLEYTEGERLYGCCYNTKLESGRSLINIRIMMGGNRRSELFCPFATEAYSTLLVWRTERFICPQGTEKILFVCENNGKINGTCAMDNIRIHKIFDVLEVEPCQRDILVFS
uniref:MAM domain-containing protein n=1 Tax=Onchocerca volvulus TaxID=6282 RepID=A0A8R1XJJ8_ONCVO